MTEPTGESFLPIVHGDDLALVTLKDILEPHHLERFHRIAQHNPALIQEIMRRAYFATQDIDNDALARLSMQKIIIDNVTFALDALEASLRRRQASGGDDDADLQP